MRSVEAGGCYKLPGDESDNPCQNSSYTGMGRIQIAAHLSLQSFVTFD